MLKSLFKLGAFGLLVTAIAAMPAVTLAQNTTPAEKKQPAEKKTSTDKETKTEKKPSPGPFHGKLVAVDKAANTITVGKRTFQITSETRINKSGKPATLDEGVIGEEASGYIKPTEDGKLVATTVNFGPKATAKAEGKKKDTTTDKKKDATDKSAAPR
jgi:hypothetical protein